MDKNQSLFSHTLRGVGRTCLTICQTLVRYEMKTYQGYN